MTRFMPMGSAISRSAPFHIRGVAWGEGEAKWPPEDIDKRVDLGRSPPARDANGIGPRPLLRHRQSGVP